MIDSREEVSQVVRNTAAQASHRSETNQRAPSGGSFMGRVQATGVSAEKPAAGRENYIRERSPTIDILRPAASVFKAQISPPVNPLGL